MFQHSYTAASQLFDSTIFQYFDILIWQLHNYLVQEDSQNKKLTGVQLQITLKIQLGMSDCLCCWCSKVHIFKARHLVYIRYAVRMSNCRL